MAKRRDVRVALQPNYKRGYGYLFSNHIEKAYKGCNFDFLRHEFCCQPQNLN